MYFLDLNTANEAIQSWQKAANQAFGKFALEEGLLIELEKSLKDSQMDRKRIRDDRDSAYAELKSLIREGDSSGMSSERSPTLGFIVVQTPSLTRRFRTSNRV